MTVPTGTISSNSLEQQLEHGSGDGVSLVLADVPIYANNAAAIAGGLTVGRIYRTGADPDPLFIVH